jgi:outer membrane protein, heavy metal efflux system
MKIHQQIITIVSTATVACFVSSCASLEEKRIIISDQTDLPNFSSTLQPTDFSSTLSTQSLAKRVSNNNPQLRAAKLKINEAAGRLSQSGRNANPTLGIGVNKSIPGTEGELGVSFSQRFPITNKLSLEKRVSADQLLIAKEEIKIAEQQLITAAQLIAVEILQLDSQQSNIDKQITSLQTIATFIDKAATAGELSPLDAAQTKLEIQTLTIQKTQLASQRNLLTTQLKQYIGLPSDKPLTLTGSLPSLSIPSQSLSLTDRADYRAKALEFQYAKSNILLEKSKRYDDVELSVSSALGRTEDEPVGAETEGAIGMGLSIPLPFYDKNEGNIEAATASAQRATLERSALGAEITLQVAMHKQEMQAWLDQNAAVRNQLIPLAQKTSADLEAAYKNGQGDFTSFLKSKNQELALQNSLLENNLKFYQARVKFYAALGQSNSAF